VFIRILILHPKILNQESKICPPTLTFAVLSQTAGSGVPSAEINNPFLTGIFKRKIKDYAR
jgi:hypothetical protein